MKVYDDEKDDFTPEYQLQLAALCQMALACELIGNKIATALDVAGYKKKFHSGTSPIPQSREGRSSDHSPRV